jgi:hypothetical protein
VKVERTDSHHDSIITLLKKTTNAIKKIHSYTAQGKKWSEAEITKAKKTIKKTE